MRRSILIRCVSAWVLFAAAAWGAAEKGDDKAVDDYNFAAWLYNTGKYGLAVDSYQAFLKNYPKHEKVPDARFGLAQSLFHLDKFADAATQYEGLRSDLPDFAQMPEVVFQLAQSRVALNQYAEAEKLFADVQTKFPDHYLADWASARRGACLISLNKFKEAEEILRAFVDKYAASGKPPEKAPAVQEMFGKLQKAGVKANDAFLALIERSAFYAALAQFNQQRFSDARDSFDRFLKDFPKSDLQDEAKFRLAQGLYQEKKYAEAAAAYKTVAEGSGEFAESAGFERGLALHKAGQLKDASAAFAETAKRFPQGQRTTKAQLYAGTCLFDSGNYAGAIEQLKPLVDAGKDLADEALYWTGMSLLKSGKPAEAETRLADALARFPKSSLAGDMRLGLADARLAQEKFAPAAEAFQQYAKEAPKAEQAPRALYSACVALHRIDQYARSDDACGELLSRYASGELAPQALFLSAENRFLLKNYEDAAKRYAELIERKDAPADRVARAHYRLAWVHRYGRRYDRALEELAKMDAAAAGKSVAAEAAYLKGACFFETGKYPEAIDAFREYMRSGDTGRFGDDAVLKTALAFLKQDKKKDAIDEFERFLKDYPKSDLVNQARYQLAECCADAKRFDQAIEHYRAVADRDPPDDLSPYALFGIGSSYYELGKWAEAADAFGKLVEKFKKPELVPQSLYRQGRSLMKIRKWDEAEKAFRELITASPRHELAPSAQAARGTCLEELKRWTEAADAFRAAADSRDASQDRARLTYELAWSLREAGKTNDALSAFDSLAAKFPTNPLAADAFFYLAEAKYADRPAGSGPLSESAAKSVTEARGLYEKVLAVPGDQRLADKAYYRIGWCNWIEGKYPEAAEAFDKLTQSCPRSDLVLDALFQSAQSYAKAGSPTQAVERLQKLIAHPKASAFNYLPEAYISLCESEIALGQTDEAVKQLRDFLSRFEKHPATAQAHLILGKARYGLKEYDRALEDLSQVTRLTRSDLAAQAQFYVGQIHQAQNDFKAAVLDYLRVPALYPDAKEWIAASTFECAKCYEALGQKDDARRAYQEVASQYRNTKWAALAAERLK